MNDFKIYQVDYFLLSSEWKEEGVDSSRISFCVTGGDTNEEHENFVQQEIKRLTNEHDDDYTSWVLTQAKTKEFGGALKFATVIIFRVRDAY
jgi:hypothetical protein